jgi:hypothetical protein
MTDVGAHVQGCSAEAAARAAHAAAQTRVHGHSETTGDMDVLMDSLAAEGPYAWMVMPQVLPDGGVRLPFQTTRDEVHDMYEGIERMRSMLSVTPLTELRGEWYTFQDCISRSQNRATGRRGATQAIALFPSGPGPGLTGELCWVRTPRSALGDLDATDIEQLDEPFLRENLLADHDRALEALRTADVDGLLAGLHPKVASVIADVAGDGGLVGLEGLDAHRAHLEAFFAAYEVRLVEPLDRVTEDWYLFAEVRVTVVAHDDPGAGELVFHTADMLVPANDGRTIVRLGVATRPVPARG